jgi:hypothetical protein
VLARKLHHALEVRDLEQRIGNGLDVYGARVGAQQCRPGLAPVGVDEVALDAKPGEFFGESTVSSVVDIAAMPLAMTSAVSPPSSAASFACSATWLGVLLMRR